MSALASLEISGEEDPLFHKLKIVLTIFTKRMASNKGQISRETEDV